MTAFASMVQQLSACISPNLGLEVSWGPSLGGFTAWFLRFGEWAVGAYVRLFEVSGQLCVRFTLFLFGQEMTEGFNPSNSGHPTCGMASKHCARPRRNHAQRAQSLIDFRHPRRGPAAPSWRVPLPMAIHHDAPGPTAARCE